MAKKPTSSKRTHVASASSRKTRGELEEEIARLEKRATGAIAARDGHAFEAEVRNYYASRGWRILSNQTKQVKGREIDLIGEKVREGFLESSKEYLLVECKQKQRVTTSDVDAFIAKVGAFYAKLPTSWGEKPDVTAVLAYRGTVAENAIQTAEQQRRPKIQFREFR